MKRQLWFGALAIAVAVIVATGCVTSSSTARQIDRQIGYLDSLMSAHASLTDKLAEIGEQIEKGKADLEALKQQREAERLQELIDDNAPDAVKPAQ